MIWIGRILTIPAGIVFVALLLLTLVLLQVNDMFLDPDFYPQALRDQDVYEFVLVDLLTTALDEAYVLKGDKLPDGWDENPLVTSGLTTADIVGATSRAIPPEWVQELVESWFDQFGKYLTGERDEFVVTIRAGERVPVLVEEAKSLLLKANAYNLLLDRVVEPRIDDAVDDAVKEGLPFGLDPSRQRLMQAVRTTISEQWAHAQVAAALDELTPYLVGERDTFEISVQLADRVDIAREELKELLREEDAYELLYSQVVEPAILENLGESVQLPFGVTVTNDEVVSALRRVAPVSWVQQQAEMLIDDASPYIAGDVDTFTTVVSLVDNKREARAVLAEIVERRLTETVDKLRACTSLAETRAALSGNEGGLPSCLPGNFSVSQLVARRGIDVSESVQRSVLGRVPDRIQFDDKRLRQALGQAGTETDVDRLDDLRKFLRDGWTFTQKDLKLRLRDAWGQEAVDKLEDIRAFLADGFSYTEADFREDIAGIELSSQFQHLPEVFERGHILFDFAGIDLPSEFRTPVDVLDLARDSFKASRALRWLVYLPMLALLVVIGFLGGRGWSGRVAWGAAFLLIGAGVIFALAGPVYESASGSLFDDFRVEAQAQTSNQDTDYPVTTRMAVGKTLDIVESVAGDFTSGIARSSLNLAIIGIAVLIVAIFWHDVSRTILRIRPNPSRELKAWYR